MPQSAVRAVISMAAETTIGARGGQMSDAARVAILMGSKSDWEVMQVAEKILDDLEIASDVARHLGPPHTGPTDPLSGRCRGARYRRPSSVGPACRPISPA